jgi:hypothetical protein
MMEKDCRHEGLSMMCDIVGRGVPDIVFVGDDDDDDDCDVMMNLMMW